MHYILLLFLSFPPKGGQRYIMPSFDTLRASDDIYDMAMDKDKNDLLYIGGYVYDGVVFKGLVKVFNPSLHSFTYTREFAYFFKDIASGTEIDGAYLTGENITGGYNGYVYSLIIMKIDTTALPIWIDTVLISGKDHGEAIKYAPGIGVFVAGRTMDSILLILKADTSGNILWSDTLYLGQGVDEVKDIAVFGDTCFITGVYVNNSGHVEGFVLKYQHETGRIWFYELPLPSASPNALDVDNEGNVYITGKFYDGTYLTFLMKYSLTGNLIWTDTIAINTLNGFKSIKLLNGYVFTGGETGQGALLMEFDRDGAFLWADTVNTITSYGYNDIAIGIRDTLYLFSIGNNDGADYYIFAFYKRFKDLGAVQILSADTIGFNTSYTPQVMVKNFSYEDTLSFSIEAKIDTNGQILYLSSNSYTNLNPQDSVVISFNDWTTPSQPMQAHLTFKLTTTDMDSSNDTISKILTIIDMVPPVIDSAIAYDGINQQEGIDDDDYVILYFSKPTNKPEINAANIDSVLNLSGGHSWLDGFGLINNAVWNLDGTQLLIRLSTNISPPTISPEDTIYPDGITITDSYGNPCSDPVVIGGSFDPQSMIKERNLKTGVQMFVKGNRVELIVEGGNREHIFRIYNLLGQVVRKGKIRKRIKISLPTGIYFLKIEDRGLIKFIIPE